MLLNDALNQKNHDIRLRDRLMSEGKLSKEEIEKVLKSLPDDAANLEEIKTGKESN